MIFNILTAPGLGNNALKSGDRLATERQTQAEHDALLDPTNLPEYQDIMLLPDGPHKSLALSALNAKAQMREREYAKYWDDQYPRRPISQSDSFIGNMNYDPYSNYLNINIGNKSYSYSNMKPSQVSDMLNAPSIGKYYNDYLKG